MQHMTPETNSTAGSAVVYALVFAALIALMYLHITGIDNAENGNVHSQDPQGVESEDKIDRDVP